MYIVGTVRTYFLVVRSCVRLLMQLDEMCNM